MKPRNIFLVLFFFSVAITLIFQINLTRGIMLLGTFPVKQIIAHENGYYLSLINESSKGHWNLGSPYFKEWSSEPFIYPALNLNTLGFIKKLFGWDIGSTALYLHYISLFLLIFFALLAFVILFEYRFIGFLIGIIYLFYPYMRTWNGLVSPEINFIPFFLFLCIYFFDIYIKKDGSLRLWMYEIFLGASTGILFYTYPYHWTFALVLLSIYDILVFVEQRKILIRNLIKYIVVALVATPYFIHMWKIVHLSYYVETMQRIGLIYSRFPAGLITQIMIATTLVSFLFFYRYALKSFKSNPSNQFMLVIAGLLASLIVLNQQLITGVQLEYNSHYLPVVMFFVIAMIGLCVSSIANGSNTKKYIVFTCIVTIVLGLVTKWTSDQYLQYSYTKSTFTKLESSIEVERWFLDNAITNSVVYAPPELEDAISTLTGNYLYFNGNQKLQLIPNSELLDRFIYFDITNNSITNNPVAYQHLVFGHTFDAILQKDDVINYIKTKLLGTPFLPNTLENYVKYDFSEIIKKRKEATTHSFLAYLKKYNVEYVIYRSNDNNPIYQSLPGKIVFANTDYKIRSISIAN